MLIKIFCLEAPETFSPRSERYNRTRWIDVWAINDVIDVQHPLRDADGKRIESEPGKEVHVDAVALIRHYGEGNPDHDDSFNVFYVRGNAADWAKRINEARKDGTDCGAPVGDEKPEAEPAPEE